MKNLSNRQNIQCRGEILGSAIAWIVIVALGFILYLIFFGPRLTHGGRAVSRTIICSSNQRALHAGTLIYAQDNGGSLLAIWDKVDDSHSIERRELAKAPYTYWYYSQGESLPGPAWVEGKGWWNVLTESYGGWSPLTSPMTPDDNPAYHCTELGRKSDKPAVYKHQFRPEMLSFSLFVPHIYDEDKEAWEIDFSYYPRPDLYTHSSSTAVITCLAGTCKYSGDVYEGHNAWLAPGESNFSSPHGGHTNVAFADGHIETLVPEDIDPAFWAPLWQSDQTVPSVK